MALFLYKTDCPLAEFQRGARFLFKDRIISVFVVSHTFNLSIRRRICLLLLGDSHHLRDLRGYFPLGDYAVDILYATHIVKAGLSKFTAVAKKIFFLAAVEHNFAQIGFLDGGIGHFSVLGQTVTGEKENVGRYRTKVIFRGGAYERLLDVGISASRAKQLNARTAVF